jgi:hypothetical protein
VEDVVRKGVWSTRLRPGGRLSSSAVVRIEDPSHERFQESQPNIGKLVIFRSF